MIQTRNIYFSAFLLNENLNIANVEKSWDHSAREETVFFTFSGGDEVREKRLQREYDSGQALTNVRTFVDNLIHVRRIIHTMVEEKKPGESHGKPAYKNRNRSAQSPA